MWGQTKRNKANFNIEAEHKETQQSLIVGPNTKKQSKVKWVGQTQRNRAKLNGGPNTKKQSKVK